MSKPTQSSLRPAVFLDRDGVVNEDRAYVYRADQLVIFPDVADSLRELEKRGYLRIVVTNQSGVARGMFGMPEVFALHRLIATQLADAGASIDAFYVCPHLAEGIVPEFARACECRKPKPGLVLEAAREFGIDLQKSFMVGDRDSDVQCAVAAGVTPILITREPAAARRSLSEGRAQASEGGKTAKSLKDALKFIL